MTLLNEAARIYLGNAMAEAVYAGVNHVWPTGGMGFETFESASAINVVITGGGLIVANIGASTNDQGAHTVGGKSGGKHYYEARLSNLVAGGSVGIGGVGELGTAFFNMQNGSTGGIMLQSAGGQIWQSFTVLGNIGERSSGDVIAFAVDLDNKSWWCRAVSPVLTYWNGNPTASPLNPVTGFPILPTASNIVAPYCTFGGEGTGPGNRVTTNFGSHSLLASVPPGFIAGWTA